MTYLGEKVWANFRPSPSERRKRTSSRERREGNDKAYLEKLRKLPCVVCGHTPAGTVHHLKQTGHRGVGMRSPDKFGLPLCMAMFSTGGEDCHGQVERISRGNELRWFNKRGIDALALCYALWGVKHSKDSMLRVLLAHRGMA